MRRRRFLFLLVHSWRGKELHQSKRKLKLQSKSLKKRDWLKKPLEKLKEAKVPRELKRRKRNRKTKLRKRMKNKKKVRAPSKSLKKNQRVKLKRRRQRKRRESSIDNSLSLRLTTK